MKEIDPQRSETLLRFSRSWGLVDEKGRLFDSRRNIIDLVVFIAFYQYIIEFINNIIEFFKNIIEFFKNIIEFINNIIDFIYNY